MVRIVRATYQDPLDRIWIACAEGMGLRVVRSEGVYAAVNADGPGVITIGAPGTLDADDCVAQMVFHEICHALVQCGENEGAWTRRDWGLDNRTERDAPRERATLRLQAEIARRHGLREFFAPTTEYRAFFDALRDDPLSDAPEDERSLVQSAMRRSRGKPFSPHLDDAMIATATVVRAVSPFVCSEVASLFDPPT